jgi:hypothetical protein|uniref:Uncharacterized protein n=1 Tax=viral metagenome TaxID=1070528 RepID=A0A6C0CWR8_9ZZZZ
MIKIYNIKLSEEIIIKIVDEYNSMIPKGCDQLKVYQKWDIGLQIILTSYVRPIKKVCIWNNNCLNINALSFCDSILLYVSMKKIIGEDNVKYI